MNGGGEGLAAPATSGAAVSPLEWKFSQVFGERTAGEEVQEGNSNTLPLIFVSFRIVRDSLLLSFSLRLILLI